MTTRRKLRLPVEVLEKARAVVLADKKPLPPPRPTVPGSPRALKREKVVAALKKLHPMD
jgi:hypothetical protein